MTIDHRPRRRASLLIAVLLAGLPGSVAAADGTPPEGSVSFPTYLIASEQLVVKSTFVDPESGLASVAISCEGGPEATYPYAPTVTIDALDPAAGGCPGYGVFDVVVRVINGEGLDFVSRGFPVEIEAGITFEYPLAPRTGKPFTIRPVYPDGYTIPSDAVCQWEFRWGSDRALRDNDHDETFGAMGFGGKRNKGYCGDWTFTLPWVPVPQFEITLEMRSGTGSLARMVRSSRWPDRELVHAAVVETDRRIHASNLPVAQVLPDTFTPIIGESITYRRYLIGGLADCCRAEWNAWMGDNGQFHRNKVGGATFTITPDRTGDLLVSWQQLDAPYLMYAMYDPPVRRRDGTDPTTTTPKLRFGAGAGGDVMPVEISWTGNDSGWGVASYRLQRSVDGGAWKKVSLPKAKSTSITQALTTGTRYRYRVRAIDKAGNVGSWRSTSSFKPRRVGDTSASPNLVYQGTWTPVADATALGGVIHEASVSGDTVRLRFRGRAIAWIAERGPDHGSAKVYIDGDYVKTVSLEYPIELPQRIAFREDWAGVGTHRIKIVLDGTAGHPIVSLDGFAILR